MKKKFMLCIALGSFVLFFNQSVIAACNLVGGTCRHAGFWNIFASFPGGDAWADDYVGNNPATLTVSRQAEEVQRRLKNCLVDSTVANSSWVEGFRGNLVIVVSGPYPTSSAAAAELSASRRCGLSGYSKFGVMNEPGAE